MTAFSIHEDVVPFFGTNTLCVKWKTPSDELLGIATLAHALVTQGVVRSDRLCLAVPNRNWAVQAQRACAHNGLETALLLAPAQWDGATQRALAALELLASPGKKAQAAWNVAGGTSEEGQRIARTGAKARGYTLAHIVGLTDAPTCAHALKHLDGEEDARELSALVIEQLTQPTLPARGSLVPIAHIRALDHVYDWVFLIGCVDGLIPAARAFEAPDEHERSAVLEADRKAFFTAIKCARECAVVSNFTHIDAHVAQQAHIRATRYKKEHGSRLALTTPSMLLEEAGAERPSTLGGQTLLRKFNLN